MMLRVAKAACVVLVLAAWGLLLSSSSSAGPTEDVADLIRRTERAFARRDVEAVLDELSDDFIAVLDPPSGTEGAVVLCKSAYGEMLERFFESGTSPDFYRTVTRDTVFLDTIAVVRKGTVQEFDDGGAKFVRTFMMARREGGQWRVLFGFPMIFHPAATVFEVTPGGQADALDIRCGDRILAYAGEEITEATQLIDAVERHSGERLRREHVLRLSRRQDELVFELDPGLIGIRVSNRLLPTDGATLIDAGWSHPMKSAARCVADAICDRDDEGLFEDVSPDGHLFVLRESWDDLRIVGTDDSPSRIRSFWRWQDADLLDRDTLECTRVRAIVRGNVGIAACRFEFETAEGRGSDQINLYAFARQHGRWRLVAALPPMGEVVTDIGLDF